ncbi:unnamed protein product [Eruca vesicaria subsp. sativa]|uniref:Late embryogenesis abundant protein LEA-2 subgroup domain-containing protein n=1 Tax=Eruca vesicaria subsp. sativa TaxID=29727 RepID=A0ABC8IWY7_ERUVS|nr:unnamed protein product [Eruca vesicaria subsp. sativa]
MQQDPNSRPAPATGYPYPYPYPNQPPASTNGYPPTAYPYQNHNPHYAPHPDPRALLIRRLFLALMVSILIFGLILFTFLLIVRPQLPTVYLNSLSVSNFSVSDNHLTGAWDLRLRFLNPNSKMSLYYDTVLCAVNHGDESLSETRLQPFDQGTKVETPVNATLSVVGTYVGGRVVDSIGKERAEKGRVEFDLRMASLVTFRYGVYRRRRYVTVYCDDVAVGVSGNSSSGKMVGAEMRCKCY